MRWLAIALIGGAIGFLGGMFGKGGSAIATPLLAAIGVPPMAALASPLPATIPGTLVAFRGYARMRIVDARLIRWSIAVGVPATILGSIVTKWIGGHALVVTTEVVVALIGARIVFFPPDRERDEGHQAPLAALIAVAAIVGFLAGLLANAGGFLLAPLYLTVLHVPMKHALSASLAVAAALATPGTIVHTALGHVDWKVTAVFAVASIPLSGLGARTAIRLDARRLERVYGLGLLVLGVVLLIVG